MKERPILFSAPMVRAELAGRKTQTRRVAKLVGPGYVKEPRGRRRWHPGDPEAVAASPYGGPGDKLWVKETWSVPPEHDSTRPRDLAPQTPVRYACDGVVRGVSNRFVDERGILALGRTRVSIHMPRWASRRTIEISVVRLERLQEISEVDAVAEGVEPCGGFMASAGCWTNYGLDGPSCDTARESYRSLWEAIHGPGSWAANPWVWVVSFPRAAHDS